MAFANKFRRVIFSKFSLLILTTFLYLIYFKNNFENYFAKVLIENEKFQNNSNVIQIQSGIKLHDGKSKNIQKFIKQLNLTNPGEDGRPVEWDEKFVTEEIKNLVQKGFDEYGCNVFVSDLIGFNRIVADNRSEYCKQKVYSENLPKVSITIGFYNEAWSILIRMIHSIFLNTPWHLIEEIILVDDYSDKENLKQPLEDYLKKLKKVKIVRSHKRLGVASGRVLGFRNAKGPIIVNLDGHIEVAPGWLEPMLDRLKDNPKLATYASVKVNHINNFGLKYDEKRFLTGIDLTQQYFIPIEMETYQPELNYWEPHRSPILIGPCFAFWKEFGEEIEYLDTGFDMWGGDDNEFSLRVWLCGGSIELVPCSAVFHLDKFHRYKTVVKGGNIWNNNRIVESWYDETFKKFYYKMMPDAVGKPFGDISKNLNVKEKLKCKNFDWFVRNVQPDMKIPDEVRNPNLG